MSLKHINHLLANEKLWFLISLFLLTLYLSPLLFTNGNFYVPVFDNLDSTVVWYKILAESGMVFANNNTTIPNMMNGLPRSSYFGEFNVILWLYYFFSPIVAFVINEVTIHIVAFFSMFIFLKRYVVTDTKKTSTLIIYAASLYFALIPFWSGAGLSVVILPLVTYSLLNIKNNISTKYDWIILISTPLYTSFVLIYIFYISMGAIYVLYDTFKNKKLNLPLFLAFFLFGTIFLLAEYRLLYSFFIDSFISHRVEFDVFFQETSYFNVFRMNLQQLIYGHINHYPGLQVKYVLPAIIIAMLLNFSSKRFNTKESMTVWLIIILSFALDFWEIALKQIYTLPAIAILIFLSLYFTKKRNLLSRLSLLLIIIILLSNANHYQGFSFIREIFPFFNTFNTSRIAFVEPFILAILLALALYSFTKKLHYANIFIITFITLQFLFSIQESFYQQKPHPAYASFEDYYAPSLFKEVKEKIPQPIESIKIVSYGLEPAISLYNNFYTLDGYSVNYPLEYKHKFRNVIKEWLDDSLYAKEASNMYDNWGGKVYILSTTVTLDFYNKKLLVKNPVFDTNALCELQANYLISSLKFAYPKEKQLELYGMFQGKNTSWDIYLYKINCRND